MATTQGWARKYWRAKKVECRITSTGMGYVGIPVGPPKQWHMTLTVGRDEDGGHEQMEITLDPVEVKDLIASMQDFLDRRRSAGKTDLVPSKVERSDDGSTVIRKEKSA